MPLKLDGLEAGFSRVCGLPASHKTQPGGPLSAPLAEQVGFERKSRLTEDALRESEERFRSAFDNAAIGMAIVDLQGGWVEVNASLCGILGYSEQELLATRFQSITHPDDLEADLTQVRQLLAGQIPHYHLPKRYIHKDGHVVWALLSTSVIRDPEGRPLYFLSQIQDITERRQVDEMLKRQAEELARSNAELEQFAYVASHDLQEPLRTVAGFCRLLQRQYHGRLDPQAEQFIGFAAEGAARMQHVVEDLLQYARLGRGKLVCEEVNASTACDQAVSSLCQCIEETNAVVLREELPVVNAHPLQLTRLFQNLVQNAIRYRGKANPVVEIRARRQAGAWLFSVKDNGIGMDPDHHKRIFQPFERLNPGEASSGTGLGLAVCERIVTLHGGRIWVESQPDAGSTFFFTLPCT